MMLLALAIIVVWLQAYVVRSIIPRHIVAVVQP